MTDVMTGSREASTAVAEATSFTCQNCGATTNFVASRSIRCPFCGTEFVLAQERVRSVAAPEALIPFEIEDAQAQTIYETWLGSGFFRQRDLLKKASDHKMRAVYLPFWEVRAEARSSWSATAGFTRYRTETYTDTEDGKSVTKTRRVSYTDWEPASGEHFGQYDRELVSASKGLPQDWIERLGDYTWSKTEDYDPRFLLGREAEESMYDRGEALVAAEALIRELEEDACGEMVPGDTHRDLKVSTRVSGLDGRPIFLPVWLASFTFNGKLYRCVVNGETGKIGGDAPLDKGRIAMVAGAVVALIAIVVVLILVLG